VSCMHVTAAAPAADLAVACDAATAATAALHRWVLAGQLMLFTCCRLSWQLPSAWTASLFVCGVLGACRGSWWHTQRMLVDTLSR
jgi:hypothetical protein